MQYSNKRRMLLSMGLGALAWGGFAKAQTASGQTLRVVVPYPPGGVVDPTARLMAAPLSAAAGRPIVIENRPGAAGAIGISAVAQARPDGNTLLFHSSTVTTSATVTYENSSKEVQSLLAPVAMIGIAPFLIVVHPAVPVNSMQELLAYA
ncbi:MAG: tripartite tricarboxylate transporter substrate-binding protein, partial [Desulfobacterales bacterium]|nr:tripartite tricarboxylate transporter substrate-binding protein [Desulfobacterales bacterium]